MHYFKSILGAAAMAAVLMTPAIAAADPGGNNGKADAAAHGNGGSHGNGPAKAVKTQGGKPAHADSDTAERSTRRVVRDVRSNDYFDRNDEAAIRRYFATSSSCPPGLAAKRNGCLPPGQAKKAWAAGSVLPRDVRLSPLPGDLLGRLPVAPTGYAYGRYDGDVYLVEDATRRIIDTIVFNLAR